MTLVGARRRELTQLVSYHVVTDQNRNVLATVMNGKRQPNHFREDHGTARPSFNWTLVAAVIALENLVQEMMINERSFFDRTWHGQYLC